jgi:hypothetical protein
MTREVGLPLAQALLDFVEGRYAVVSDRLFSLRQTAQRFGGSNAQRDVIELTLLEACKRAGQRTKVNALLGERALIRGSLPRVAVEGVSGPVRRQPELAIIGSV